MLDAEAANAMQLSSQVSLMRARLTETEAQLSASHGVCEMLRGRCEGDADALRAAEAGARELERHLAGAREALIVEGERRDALEALLRSERDAFARHIASAPTREAEAGLKGDIERLEAHRLSQIEAFNARVAELEAGLKAKGGHVAQVEGILARTVLELDGERTRGKEAAGMREELKASRQQVLLLEERVEALTREVKEASRSSSVAGARDKAMSGEIQRLLEVVGSLEEQLGRERGAMESQAGRRIRELEVARRLHAVADGSVREQLCLVVEAARNLSVCTYMSCRGTSAYACIHTHTHLNA